MDGMARSGALACFCILAARSAGGFIAKVFNHNMIQSRNRGTFSLRQARKGGR
jgi:hypothetical protein